ncbi:hypothetical protein, conserved [Angomonas deanei]|uniref:RRM domain-containing protein n=1 Tax=Angomonas deanei TaxID=59799 RepID=A0A7G2CCZ0_9TRYP|nr:hypothetical protein, conserved [Angomonas deanei]
MSNNEHHRDDGRRPSYTTLSLIPRDESSGSYHDSSNPDVSHALVDVLQQRSNSSTNTLPDPNHRSDSLHTPDSSSTRRRRRRFNNNCAVLHVGQIPQQATRNDIIYLFSHYGRVMEVVLRQSVRGVTAETSLATLPSEGSASSGEEVKVTSSAFVSYFTTEEADRAIRCLHDTYSMDGTSRPLQVSYCVKTDKISQFGYQQALQLHAQNPCNQIPLIRPDETD